VVEPEKARTGFCFLEREMALRKWRKTEPVVFSGVLSLVLSLDGQRKNNDEYYSSFLWKSSKVNHDPT
jgi:hypothetical protein